MKRSASQERAIKQKRNERRKALKAAREAGIELPPLKRGRPTLTEEQKAERIAQNAICKKAFLQHRRIQEEKAADLAQKTEIQAALARCPQHILDELDREYLAKEV